MCVLFMFVYTSSVAEQAEDRRGPFRVHKTDRLDSGKRLYDIRNKTQILHKSSKWSLLDMTEK